MKINLLQFFLCIMLKQWNKFLLLDFYMMIELPSFLLVETDTMGYKPANPVSEMEFLFFFFFFFLRSSPATESGERNCI